MRAGEPLVSGLPAAEYLLLDPVRPLHPVPIHPRLRPRRSVDVAELRRVIALMNDRIKGTSGATIRFRRLHRLFAPHGLPAPAGALISRPRLPFIFSLVFSPSPFRTISSGTCPPEVNLPCTCRCLAPPPLPSPSRSTAAPPRRAIVLLNSICFLISLSHSFSVTRPEVGERADCARMGYTFGPRRSKKSRQPSILSRRVGGCLEAIRREVMALARPSCPRGQHIS